MKFCPQCGTTFEPGARFCLECGFDRSTVEPVSITPDTTPAEVAAAQPQSTPACPQCGSKLDSGERFCAECGFDTARTETTNQVEEVPPVEPVTITETIAQPEPVLQTGTPEVEMKNLFCPQCGAGISIDDRFCPECGFDTSTAASFVKDFVPVLQPEKIPLAGVHQDESVVSPLPPVPLPKPEPANLPPPEPVRVAVPPIVPPVSTSETVMQQKSKKSLLRIVIILVVLVILAVAGWFAYNSFFGGPAEKPADSLSNMALPPVDDVDSATTNTAVVQEATETPTQQPAATSKPMSKIDQELAKQKAKQQNKPAQVSPTPVQQATPEQTLKTAPANENDKMAKVILEVGKKEDAKNKNPKNPVKLVIANPTMIVRITTDHYNNGMGTPGGGTISLKDKDGKVIATFKAYGKDGNDGTPNAKWVCEPHKVLIGGTYFIWDSDFSTWSKNFLGNAFVVVEGYEVE